MLQAQPSIRRNLHQQMVEALAEQIVSGQVAPGEILPNEDDMGESFKVSRTVVREAVKVLSSKGMIEVRTKVGARVRPESEWALGDPDLITWKLAAGGDAAFVTEMLEMRALLDPAAAGAAAKRVSAERRKRLQEAFDRAEAATGDPEAFAEAESAFLNTIRDLSGNRLLRSLGRLIGGALPAAGTKPSVTLHRRVLEAVLAGKSEEAERAMQKLVASGADDIAKAVSRLQRARKRG